MIQRTSVGTNYGLSCSLALMAQTERDHQDLYMHISSFVAFCERFARTPPQSSHRAPFSPFMEINYAAAKIRTLSEVDHPRKLNEWRCVSKVSGARADKVMDTHYCQRKLQREVML
jgi:hypothetical protein